MDLAPHTESYHFTKHEPVQLESVTVPNGV
jgi:hypothetical protein